MTTDLFDGWESNPIGKKKCSSCKLLKTESEFDFGTVSGKGKKLTRTGKCKKCRHSMMRQTANIKKRIAPPPAKYRCPICNSSSPGKNKNWDCDHDHTTGNFRGWLCRNCNIGLGRLDTETKLKNAIRYLTDAYKRSLPENLFGE